MLKKIGPKVADPSQSASLRVELAITNAVDVRRVRILEQRKLAAVPDMMADNHGPNFVSSSRHVSACRVRAMRNR